MGLLQNDSENENIYYVSLDKAGKQSFGICVLSGQVRDAPNSKTSGIFIKGVVPDSPADATGKFSVGDRVLSINEKDVRYATEHTVIKLIKEAGTKISMKCSKQSEKFSSGSNFTNLKSQFENQANNNESSNDKENDSNENVTEKGSSGLNFKQPHRATLVPRHSVRRQNYDDDDDDDEDTRDMTGRLYNSEGYEIDRASAANFKLVKADREKDKEQPDVFGYTMLKINKRYVNMKSIMKVEFNRPPNTELGLALSGHKDRQVMACFVAGIHPSGVIAKQNVDLKKGDEIIEVNGRVLQRRCHLNATVVITNLPGEKVVFLINRPKVAEKDYPIAIREVNHYCPFFDETADLFQQYKEAKLVQIVKIESIGIMIIEGKHKEIGSGIFISDIQEDSGAQQAGLIVGDVILAVNKDVLIKTNYDFAHGILKRAQGVVNLIVVSLKGGMDKEKGPDGKAEEKVKEPEKPADPTTDPVKINKKTLVDIKMANKPAGIVLSGGYGSLTRIGVFISYIHPDGVFGKDGRLQVFDQILEVAGSALPYKDMTHHVLHQRFCAPMEKIVMAIYRADPPETETVTVEFTRKAGKELGLSVMCNEKGAVISHMVLGLYPDLDGKVGRGDIIRKINNDVLENLELVQVYALFQKAVGKVSLEIIRPQPEKERRE